jgi:hypothetical protein
VHFADAPFKERGVSKARKKSRYLEAGILGGCLSDQSWWRFKSTKLARSLRTVHPKFIRRA